MIILKNLGSFSSLTRPKPTILSILPSQLRCVFCCSFNPVGITKRCNCFDYLYLTFHYYLSLRFSYNLQYSSSLIHDINDIKNKYSWISTDIYLVILTLLFCYTVLWFLNRMNYVKNVVMVISDSLVTFHQSILYIDCDNLSIHYFNNKSGLSNTLSRTDEITA